MIKIELVGETYLDVYKQARDLFGFDEPKQVESKAEEAKKVEPKPETKKVEPKPEPKVEEKAEPKEEAKKPAVKKRKAPAKKETTLSYEDDVRPVLMQLANILPEGRTTAIKLINDFGAATGEQLKPKDYAKVLELAQQHLEELSEDEDEDF